MAFSTVTPRLFQATMQQPDTNATGAFNIGAKLAELRNQNDPNRQFVEALKTRMVEDQKNRAIRQMFKGAGVDVPEQSGFSQLIGGVQDPTEVLKTAATIQSGQLTNLLNSAKIKTEMAKAKNFEQGGGRDPLVDQYDAYNEDGSIDFSKLPPNTSAYTDRYGNVRIRVNPNPIPTEWQANAISGAEKFEPLVSGIQQLIDNGALKGGWDKYLAEGGDSWIRRILTPDNTPLEQLASKRAELIKYVFSEGGKQLTEGEKQTVKAGLDFVGKSDAQIKQDLAQAISILRSKGELATGGKMAAKTFNQGQSLTLEQKAQQAIANGADPVAVMARLKKLQGA